MMKCQEKPLEAFHWNGVASSALKQFVLPYLVPRIHRDGSAVVEDSEYRSFLIRAGDYVLRPVTGGVRVLSEEEFKAAYDILT